MNKKRILTTLSLLCLTIGVAVPVAAQTNLLFDGDMEIRERAGFTDVVDGKQVGGEETLQPLYWYIKTSSIALHTIELKPEYRRPGTSGQYGMMVKPAEEALDLRNVKWDWGRDDYKLELKPNTEYKYAFWVRSKHGKGKLQITLEFGRKAWAKSKINSPIKVNTPINTTKEWQKVVGTFTTPSHEEVGNSQFIISLVEGIWETSPGQFETEEYYFDDASLYLATEAPIDAPKPTLPQATNVASKAYQREIEFSWNSTAKSNAVTWEIYLNDTDKPHVTTKDTRIVLTGLKPNTEYKIKIRGIKGKDFSEWHEETIKTQAISIAIDDPNRTPYLRTITMSGQVPIKLPLYFNDLYADNAKITATVDGLPAQIVDNHIQFKWQQPTGEHYQRHTVVIKVDEGNGKTFTLTYYLTVTDTDTNFHVD